MRNQKGFSLVEVLIASAILSIVIMTVAGILQGNVPTDVGEKKCLSWRDEVIYENGESRVVQLCNEYSNF